MLAVQDRFVVPLKSWEEKVTATIRICKQDKHLTTQGVPSAVHALGFPIGASKLSRARPIMPAAAAPSRGWAASNGQGDGQGGGLGGRYAGGK